MTTSLNDILAQHGFQKDYFCKGWVQVLMVVILKIMVNLIVNMIYNDQYHDHEGEDLLDRTVFVI